MNHYKKEEPPTETPEMLMENHQTQLATTDGLAVQTAEAVNRVEQNLGWLLQHPSLKGDADAQNAITYVWGDAQQMATAVVQLDAVRTGSAAFAKRIMSHLKKIAGDYEHLENAVTSVDMTNPQIRKLVEDTEDGVYENLDDEMYYQDALEAVYENFYTEASETMRDITDINDPSAISALVDVLTGNTTPSETQRDLLRKLVSSFQKPGNHNDGR